MLLTLAWLPFGNVFFFLQRVFRDKMVIILLKV